MPYRLQVHGGMNDEALVIQAARRILEGELPYRDFDMLYTPGSMGLTALWMAIAGPSMEAMRWLMCCCAGALTATIFLVSARVLPSPWRFLPPILFMVSGYSEWPILSYHWFAILALLICVYHALLWEEMRRDVQLVISGVACGLSALCLQSDGLAGLASMTGILVLLGWGGPWKIRVRWMSLFVGGILVVWLPFLLALAITGSWSSFFQNTVFRVLGGLYENHAAPYDFKRHVWQSWAQIFAQWPTQWDKARCFWLLESCVMVGTWTFKYGLLFPVMIVAAWIGFRRKDGARVLMIFLPCWTFVMRERLDLLYANYLTPLWYIAVTLCLYELWQRRRSWGRIALALLGLGYFFIAMMAWRYTVSFIYPLRTPAGLLWCRDVDQARSLGQLYAMAWRLTPPGTVTFAWPYAASFYVLSQTKNPSRVEFLTPGWQDLEQAKDAASSLSGVTYLYYLPLDPHFFVDYPMLNPETFQAGIKEYGRLLYEGFMPKDQLGPIVIYERMSHTNPSD